MDPVDAGNLRSRLVPKTDSEMALAGAREAMTRIRSLAPPNSELISEITSRVIAGTNEVAFCFRGLEFARWSQEGIVFGLHDPRERLAEGTQPRLARLMRDLDLHRRAEAANTNHPVYRVAPERWLETLVLHDPACLDAQLDARHIYSQIPAVAGATAACWTFSA